VEQRNKYCIDSAKVNLKAVFLKQYYDSNVYRFLMKVVMNLSILLQIEIVFLEQSTRVSYKTVSYKQVSYKKH